MEEIATWGSLSAPPIQISFKRPGLSFTSAAPAISDLIAEVVLAGVDLVLSRSLSEENLANDVLIVRFKDDYRILTKHFDQGKTVLKCLQTALQDFRLDLNETKTQSRQLPDGLFRPWSVQYRQLNPRPTKAYDFRRFQKVYLGVIEIDRNYPGTGIVDRFLSDLISKKYKLRIKVQPGELQQVASLLLLLPTLRAKSLPKVLAILEALIRQGQNEHLAIFDRSQMKQDWNDDALMQTLGKGR